MVLGWHHASASNLEVVPLRIGKSIRRVYVFVKEIFLDIDEIENCLLNFGPVCWVRNPKERISSIHTHQQIII